MGLAPKPTRLQQDRKTSPEGTASVRLRGTKQEKPQEPDHRFPSVLAGCTPSRCSLQGHGGRQGDTAVTPQSRAQQHRFGLFMLNRVSALFPRGTPQVNHLLSSPLVIFIPPQSLPTPARRHCLPKVPRLRLLPLFHVWALWGWQRLLPAGSTRCTGTEAPTGGPQPSRPSQGSSPHQTRLLLLRIKTENCVIQQAALKTASLGCAAPSPHSHHQQPPSSTPPPPHPHPTSFPLVFLYRTRKGKKKKFPPGKKPAN